MVAARPETVERAGFYDFHAAKGNHVQGALRVADKVQRERDLLNVVFFLLARPAPIMSPAIRSIATLAKGTVRRPLLIDLPGHLGNVAAGLGDVAAMVRAYLRRGARAGRVLMMCVQGEQAPKPGLQGDTRLAAGPVRASGRPHRLAPQRRRARVRSGPRRR